MMKRSLKLLLCAVLALSLILGCAGAGAEGTGRKKVTVMVYMCGADLEQLAKGTQTISEMYSTHFNQDAVNVIALCGGTRRWASRLDDSVLSVVDVGKGGRRSLHVAAQLPLALSTGFGAVKAAVAIVLGIILAMELPQRIFSGKQPRPGRAVH